MTSYVVGRSESGEIISVGPSYKNVSRRHLEFSLVDEARCRIVDLESANGTEVLNRGKWEPIKKAVIGLDHKLRLGREYETTVRELIELSSKSKPPAAGATRVYDDQADRGAVPVGEGGQHVALHAKSGMIDRGYSSRALPVRGICHTCGKPVHSEFCMSCGARLVSNAQGIIGVVAQDLFKFGENDPLLPRLLMLIYAPVRATLALALDPHFRLHTVMFLLATMIYLAWSNFLEFLTLRNIGGLGIPNLAQTVHWVGYTFLGPALFFAFFIFAFIIGYYVFCDYSKAPRPPREYLKLCCISFLVSVLASVALTVPIALQLSGFIPKQFAVWLFAVVGLTYIIFQLRYNVLVTTKFWGISTVSAFRGLLVAYLLAFIALSLIVVVLALLYRIVIVPLV
jgi:FHA domain